MSKKRDFEDELEDFLDGLEERERPPAIKGERVEQIREFIERKRPFENPHHYIAKHIKGLDEYKRLIALSAISPLRPIHSIAIGDPAVGKSEIGIAFQEITPRVQYAWGSKLTAAGLTLSRLGNKVMVGVLPKAHMGCAIIDEFNLCPSTEAAAVLSTMQHSYFGIEKAFLKVDYVPAKCSIIALANPSGDYWLSSNPHQIRRQMPLRSLALLTRFHLVFILLRPSLEEFGEISRHMLKFRMGKESCSFDDREKELWRDAVLYLRYLRPAWTRGKGLKRRVIAEFTKECYRGERRGGIAVPVSPRLNEGVSALAEAFARANLRSEVWMRDVVKSAFMVANSLTPCGLNIDAVKKKVAEVLKS